jgi:hypothetical protein
MSFFIVMLAWLAGTCFGAFWVTSLEHGQDKKAGRYGFYMAYFYSAGVVLAAFSALPALWVILAGIFVVIVFVALVVFYRQP